MSIGSDPRIQAIIEAYREGEYDPYYQQNKFEVTPGQFYNPIYDIRTEQIKAGELEEGARFPKMDIEEKKEEEKQEEPFDPCPPGYQLVGGVCQPDTMFQRGGGGRGGFTPPKVEDGVIEGFQELEPRQQMMGTFYESLSPAMKAEYEKASSYGRGIQFKRDADGNVIRIVAKSPTLSQLAGDIGGAMGSMFGGYTDSLMGGGLIGGLLNLFKKDQPKVTYGGGSNINIREFGPTVDLRKPIIDELITTIFKRTGDPISGTGSFGPPGRNYPTPAITRATQAASRLGTTLATRGK